MRSPPIIGALRAASFTSTLVAAVASWCVLSFGSGVARAESRAGYGGAVQGALPSTPVSLDPLSSSLGDQELALLLYDTPFRLDAAGQPRPHLAVSLDPPPVGVGEGLQPLHHARLRIRTDVKFHDGTPLRAADVAASLNRAVRDPRGWALGPIRAARALGDDTVEIDLVRAAPDLALLLSTPAAAVTPNGAPVNVGVPKLGGSGPFFVESLLLGEGAVVQLAANPRHFAGRPYLDTVTLRGFGSRTQEGQSFEVGALQASRHGGAAFPTGARRAGAVVDGLMSLTGYLAFGRALPDDIVGALRAALAVGIDRERVRKQVRDAARAAGGAAPPSLGGPEARAPFDAAAARARLEQRFPSRQKVMLLIDRSRFDDRAVAERLLAELQRLGVDVTIDAADASVFQKRQQAGTYELCLGTSVPPAPDGGLAELALLAAVDPAAARVALQRAPAAAGTVDFATTRVIPLYHRGTRLHLAPELRGLKLDAEGRASWADAYLRR